MSDNVTYTHQAYTGNTEDTDATETDTSTGSKAPVTIKDESGSVIFRINYTTPFSTSENDEFYNIQADGESDVFLLEQKVNNFGDVRIR